MMLVPGDFTSFALHGIIVHRRLRGWSSHHGFVVVDLLVKRPEGEVLLVQNHLTCTTKSSDGDGHNSFRQLISNQPCRRF